MKWWRVWKWLLTTHRELLRCNYIQQIRPQMIRRHLGIKPQPTSIFYIELVRADAEVA